MSRAPEAVEDLIARALAEDLGDGDATSLATVPPDLRAVATITQKAPGVVSGTDVAVSTLRTVDPDVTVERLVPDGRWREGGPVLRATGNARALLAGERTALNFMGRLSGIATLTRRYVDAVRGTDAVVLDTRKTTPTLRMLEKRAVRDGGGGNHRVGLYDQILIKENHAAMAGGVGAAVHAAHASRPDLPIVSECRDLDEVREALAAAEEAGLAADRFRVLLDNMTTEQLRDAVALTGGRFALEASGNVNLGTVGAIAATGVDFISAGALTHSAPVLDLSLILEPLP
ncbi:MAG: carboxylating nicotinate-nucleotide diphosphorylase [Solirubrobacteraceae bacterium]|nr:carboxylating nicotinate-nucleotide diphosphorylase [Solirubrobacteraceae bacterium]